MTTADEIQDFTEQECQLIFGVGLGFPNRDIAQVCGITENVVQYAVMSICDKLGVRPRLELHRFARAALNAELRRRRLSPGDSGAAMGG